MGTAYVRSPLVKSSSRPEGKSSSGGGPDSSGLPAVSYVVPSLLFDELSLKQAAGPFPNPPLSKPPIADGTP